MEEMEILSKSDAKGAMHKYPYQLLNIVQYMSVQSTALSLQPLEEGAVRFPGKHDGQSRVVGVQVPVSLPKVTKAAFNIELRKQGSHRTISRGFKV